MSNKEVIYLDKNEFLKYGCSCGNYSFIRILKDQIYGGNLETCKECGQNIVVIDRSEANEVACKSIQEHPLKDSTEINYKVKPNNQIGEFCYTSALVDNNLICSVRTKEVGKNIIKMFEKINGEHNDENYFSCYFNSPENFKSICINTRNLEIKNLLSLKYLIEDNSIITEEKIKFAQNIEWNFLHMWFLITRPKLVSLYYKNYIFASNFDDKQHSNFNVEKLLEYLTSSLMVPQSVILLNKLDELVKSGDISEAISIIENLLLNFDSTLFERSIMEKMPSSVSASIMNSEYIKTYISEHESILAEMKKFHEEYTKGKTKVFTEKNNI